MYKLHKYILETILYLLIFTIVLYNSKGIICDKYHGLYAANWVY